MHDAADRTCPEGHPMESSWDVCPHCALPADDDDLTGTRVQAVGGTQMLDLAGSAPALLGWLVVLSGEQLGEVFPVEEERLQIGRDPSCQVRLTDPAVSDIHARLVTDIASGYPRHLLVDLDSSNGTYLNEMGRRVEREEIVDGDLLRLGEVDVIFKALPAAAVRAIRGDFSTAPDRPDPHPSPPPISS